MEKNETRDSEAIAVISGKNSPPVTFAKKIGEQIVSMTCPLWQPLMVPEGQGIDGNMRFGLQFHSCSLSCALCRLQRSANGDYIVVQNCGKGSHYKISNSKELEKTIIDPSTIKPENNNPNQLQIT